jgi:F-type H+-transporting ATPase subunit delta
MAELTTIARPYAEAAFRIASDANALPVWSEMLGFLCDVTSEPRATAALDNPKLTAADKTALLLTIGGERLDAGGRSFVRVLVEADRIAVLPQIRRLFEGIEERRRRRGRSEDRHRLSRSPMRKPAELKAALEKRFGRKIDATVHVDPALGGGARITVGDTVIDGTIEAQLAGHVHPIASLNPITIARREKDRRDARTPCS